MEYLEPRKIKGALVKAGVADKGTIIGCSTEEIRTVQKELGVKLPRSYREFLRVMGKSAGTFLDDLRWKHADLPQIRLLAEIHLQETYGLCEAQLKLKKTHFVFSLRQGDFFLYFETNVGNDPPVLNSESGNTYFPSFSSWLLAVVEEEVSWQQHKKRRSILDAIEMSD